MLQQTRITHFWKIVVYMVYFLQQRQHAEKRGAKYYSAGANHDALSQQAISSIVLHGLHGPWIVVLHSLLELMSDERSHTCPFCSVAWWRAAENEWTDMKAWYVDSKLTPAYGRIHQTETAKELAAKKTSTLHSLHPLNWYDESSDYLTHYVCEVLLVLANLITFALGVCLELTSSWPPSISTIRKPDLRLQIPNARSATIAGLYQATYLRQLGSLLKDDRSLSVGLPQCNSPVEIEQFCSPCQCIVGPSCRCITTSDQQRSFSLFDTWDMYW